MSEQRNEVVQKAAIGGQTTQIGVQYNGMSPQDACKLTIQLFEDNFPKLQEKAGEIARERANEFCNAVMEKLKIEKVEDLSPFGDPDVQYVLLKAQKDYARFGEKELLDTLAGLVSQRIEHDDEFRLKVSIDKAIDAAAKMPTEYLNFLSLLFLVTEVKIKSINSIESLQLFLNMLCSIFEFSFENISHSYLNMLSCLRIALLNPVDVLSKTYGFPVEEVDRICSKKIKDLRGDYGVSEVGTILAIVNAEQKTELRFNMKTWIK